MTLTTKQYADLRGISDAAVRKAIKLNHRLPGVTGRKKFGRAHVLVINEEKLKAFMAETEKI